MGPGSEKPSGSAEDFSLVTILASKHSHSRYNTVCKLEIQCPTATLNMKYEMFCA